MNTMPVIKYQSFIHGEATGELLVSETGLSFWGGVDPTDGLIIDQHHPLHNHHVCGKILALPSGRGSSSGSGAILELLLNDVAPAALIFMEPEDILTLGVMVSEVMFERSIPVCRITSEEFKKLQSGVSAQISNGEIRTASDSPEHPQGHTVSGSENDTSAVSSTLKLTESDQQLLDGSNGEAAQLAMRIVVRMAELQGAEELVDVSLAHIDACVYNGPSTLLFAQHLASLGGKVRIPTTLNSLSVDKRRWKQQGVDEKFATPASQLGDAYLEMGAQPSYTCAPYLLDSAPQFGQQIVWAEACGSRSQYRPR